MSRLSATVLNLFSQINAIPRCSENERGMADWIENWANERGFESLRDAQLNVMVRVPARLAAEECPTVILQGHTDMVCEKTPNSDHDFTRDPIRTEVHEGWLTAVDTTLGADNGIAIAMAMALAADEELVRPPLELLFTSQEETGLVGAQALCDDWLTGRMLLNLDSEDEGTFTIGCAGGRDTDIELPIQRIDSPDGQAFELAIGGLEGGHSGIEINKNRGNANQLLVRLLADLAELPGFALASVEGGNAHNAIARDARAMLLLPSSQHDAAQSRVADLSKRFTRELAATEPRLSVTFGAAASRPTHVFDQPSATTLIRLLLAIPHGVVRMSDDVPGLVETSSNFATIRTEEKQIRVKTSQRSSLESQLSAIAQRHIALAELAGASWSMPAAYPPWEPMQESTLVDRCTKIYERVAGVAPTIDVVHAGLECGVIGAKYPEMEMISLGPNIRQPHSPDERVELASVERTVEFVGALLREVARGQ